MATSKPGSARFKGDGLITFPDVPGAIKGEKVLKAAGYDARLVAPPPSFRMGCELGLEILGSNMPEIERLFKEKGVEYSGFVSLS